MSEIENIWKIKIGQTAELTTVVDTTNTANAVKSGLLDVFATPMMIALMENAADDCISQNLQADESTVGVIVNIKHFRASGLGKEIKAQAEVVEVNKNKVKFKVVAYDNDGEIGKGEHQRAIINIPKFLKRLEDKIN